MRLFSRLSAVSLAFLVFVVASSDAKLRNITRFRPRPREASVLKEVIGTARFILQQKLFIRPEISSFHFQEGNLSEHIEFFQTPRCYLHFIKNAEISKEVLPGQIFKIRKIDNIYASGSVHVTFWFDENRAFSDLTCITNYDHTLTLAELRLTLGNFFQVEVSEPVESGALYNTAPKKKAKVLSEEDADTSARIILSDT